MLYGLIAAALAAILTNLGLILQKFALDRRPFEAGVIRAFFTPTWALGFAMIQFGWLAQLLALRRAPLYLVQPVVASGLLLLAAAARIHLKERVGIREWMGIGAVTAGVAGLSVIAMGSIEESRFPMETRSIATFLTIIILPALAISFGARHVPRRRSEMLAISAGLLYALTVILSKPLAALLQGKPSQILNNILTRYELYAILALSLAALLINQHALARGRAVTVVPIVTVVMVLLPVAAGLTIFHERLPSGTGRYATLTAVILCVAGVWVLGSEPGIARFTGNDDRARSSSEVVRDQKRSLQRRKEP